MELIIRSSSRLDSAKLRLLPVAEEQILADLGSQDGLDFQAVLHGVGVVRIYPGKFNPQFLQFIVDGLLLGDALVGGTASVADRINIHGTHSFIHILSHHSTEKPSQTKSHLRDFFRDYNEETHWQEAAMKIYRIGQTLAALEQMPETGEGTLVLLTSEELDKCTSCRDWRVLLHHTPAGPGRLRLQG